MRLLLLSLLLSLAGATEDEGSPMRWRVFCDVTSQTAFRFPYQYSFPNQYLGALKRCDDGRVAIRIESDKPLDEQELKRLIQAARSNASDADLRHLAGSVADLPGLDPADPLALVSQLSKGKLNACTPLEYYAPKNDPLRPHAALGYAPEGISAWELSGPAHCGRLLRWADRYALLLASGQESEHDNRDIFDSLEVLTGRKRPQTWRATMALKGLALNREGGLLKAPAKDKTRPASWEGAWEVETEHYHVSCNVSPGATLEYARMMEALYEFYASVYEPETVPPYKMEIHIFESEKTFRRMAAQRGPIPSGWIGFFSSGDLCVYAYDRGGASMGTETVLAHEASHQFLHVTCNGSAHVPTWINEGLAVFFESGEYSNGRYSWQPPKQRLDHLRSAYARENTTLIPLDQYLDYHGPIDSLQYGEVYAMTHFWVFGSAGGAKRFKEYWHALKDGEDGAEAFERIFMTDLIAAQGGRDQAIAAWQQNLLRYVLKGYPSRGPE